VRGFGFLHDGSVGTVNLFLQAPVFTLSATQEGQLEQFLLAFDTGQKPAVGQQVTAAPANASGTTTINRIALLAAQADAGNVELIAKGVVSGEPTGWRYAGSGFFESDRRDFPLITTSALRSLGATAGQEITFTSVPLGSGERLGIDRDGDGTRDGDERDLGTDPGDPSMPTECSDRIDNDGDGQLDAADPGCRDATAASESPSCSDGLDNEGDGLVDMADPDCGNPWSDNETLLNRPCGLLGIEVLPVLLWSALRRRRRVVV